jgi:DNA-binding GntR family transcriptional regulator
MAEIAAHQQQPVENLTLWQRVYEHLRSEILDGRLEPGTELGEVALSAQLGVSRGPLREAIGRLAAEGLVMVRPRRGAIVRELSEEEFLELYQVREAIEGMAVKLAVPRLTPDDVEALWEINGRMAEHAQRSEIVPFFQANLEFHGRLIEACANQKLRELYQQLLDQLQRYRMRSLTLRGNLQRSVAEHAAIIRAAKRGDAERAAQLMADHIRVPQRRLNRASKGAR